MSARVDAVASRVQGALTTRKVSLQVTIYIFITVTNCQISVLFDFMEMLLLYLMLSHIIMNLITNSKLLNYKINSF